MNRRFSKRWFAAFFPAALVGCAIASAGWATPSKTEDVIPSHVEAPSALPPWQPGYLDIHHIQTGRGNAAFAVLPDGTTLLIDAGALEDDWARNYGPLKLAPAVPDGRRRPGEWIADYIEQFAPPGTTGIDYALITHFHPDHLGRVQKLSPRSAKGDWKLAGLTDVAERWPIGMLIDRGYPSYDFPSPQRDTKDPSLANYFRFVDANVAAGRMKAERLAVGKDDQIVCRKSSDRCADFSVRNIAANGVMWTGHGEATRALLDPTKIKDAKGKFNENPLSTVIKINYGKFDYVTGGDLTGVSEPDQPGWFNVESKVAPAIGEVDAMTLNHHGNRDATNADWLRILTPRVLVQQTWVSDHPGGEVVARITSQKLWPADRDIFATHVHDETKTAIGPWLTRNYKSTDGHVVIRVSAGGGTYVVYVLNDRNRHRNVIARFGPYQSRHP